MVESDIDQENYGVIYLAFGYEYLVKAINSAKTLNSTNPDIPASVVTNMDISNIKVHELPGETSNQFLFDEVIYVDGDNRDNRQYKTSINSHSPYDRTLYLDCDTEVKSDIRHGFDFLDHFDLAFPSYPFPPVHMANKWFGDLHIDGVELLKSPYFGGGVFIFGEDSGEFFKLWNDTYNKYGYEKDQFSLLSTIYTSGCTVLPLQLTWDATDVNINWNPRIKDDVIIRHHSYDRVAKLRNIEANVFNSLVDTSNSHILKEREQFRKRFSMYRGVKSKAVRNPLFGKVYSKLGDIYKSLYNTG